MGKNIYEKFKDKAEIITLTNNKIKGNIPGDNIMEYYKEGKNTLVVGVKKGYKFQSCKPSAHWQLPLLSGCVGNCQYCYLNTNLEDKPFIKINVNIDDYEKRTANREKRIEASVKMMKAGYPVGYIIAPVFMYEGWEKDYRQLLIYLSEKIPNAEHITIDEADKLINHQNAVVLFMSPNDISNLENDYINKLESSNGKNE